MDQDTLQDRACTQHYTTARDFDQDLSRLFERARRWHVAGTENYGHSILLQVCRYFLIYCFAHIGNLSPAPLPPPYHFVATFNSLNLFQLLVHSCWARRCETATLASVRVCPCRNDVPHPHQGSRFHGRNGVQRHVNPGRRLGAFDESRRACEANRCAGVQDVGP